MERTRRDVLRTAMASGVAGAAAVGVAGAPVAHASDRERTVTFVFVTGANGSSSGVDELVLRGHRTVGVPLPGHAAADGQFRHSYQAPQDLDAFATEPSPVAGITIDDFEDRVVAGVRRVARHGPVVLVGGSMGGASLSRVGNRVPHLIDHLVYDSAFCCTKLESCAEYLQTAEGSTSLGENMLAVMVGDPGALGASRSNFRTADGDALAKLRQVLMAHGSDHEFYAMLNTLQPDETLDVPVADARGREETWGRIPRTYVKHTYDRMLPLALQERMIAEADELTPRNRFTVHEVKTDHVPTEARFAEVADILDGIAREL